MSHAVIAQALSVPDYAAERALLNDILARQEFRGVHGPTWLDYLHQRILQILVRMLGRVLAPSAISTIGDLVVNALLVLAVLVSAIWIYRLIRGRAAPEANDLAPSPEPLADWTMWLRGAQTAAARANWRDAIHLTYWCAVAFLEARGAWHPDRARTPREYVRLLPAPSDAADGLTALTRRFELVWYGTAEANERTFDESLADLKKVGCPVA